MTRRKGAYGPHQRAYDETVPNITKLFIDADWVVQAACRDYPNPDAFFPSRGGSTEEARAICSECPVQPDCLDHALKAKETIGYWGNKSERERRRMRREISD